MSVSIKSNFERFALAGRAVFTVRNDATGNRFTYRVKRSKNGDVFFVSVKELSGHRYVGMIDKYKNFRLTKNSNFGKDDVEFRAFGWLWKFASKLPESVNVFHEGKCGRCGRALTVPESIESGFGPECITKV